MDGARPGAEVDDGRSLRTEGVATQSTRSLWRYPSKPTSVPDYMRRAFRSKCFALVSLQLMCVIAVKALVDHYRPWNYVLDGQLAYVREEVFFYASGSGTLLCIAVLQCVRDQYPWNYLVLAMATLLCGFFWGMLRARVLTTMHYQILGILLVTMAVAAVLSRISMRFISKPLLCLLAPGWIAGSVVCVLVMTMTLESPSPDVMWMSIGLSLLQLIVMALDGGRYLTTCQPDDFMKVIVAMNSTLMVVVSIPFFVISVCFIHTSEAFAEEARTPQSLPVAPAPEEITEEELERGELQVPAVAA